MFLYLNICLLLSVGLALGDGPRVETELGPLSGFYMNTRGGREIAAFTAIPYAVPPLQGLRFKAPKPVSAWTGTLNASRVTPECVQRNPYVRQQEIVGQEDCLYLNVYTPTIEQGKVTTDKKLPVMVFIHGGGWMCGSSTTFMYGPEFLLDRDVLLVTINYRLGPLGFLSTLDENCPGNNGLKDQQEALRWIQRHIHNFGGEKNSVTLFGESAGGASAHFHMLSPTSAGLFHKAISESGTAFVPWAEAPPGEALKQALKLAKFLDCPPAPSDKMITCLRTRDSYDIIGTEFNFYSWDYEPMTTFKAVVEPDLPGAFLTKYVRDTPEVSPVPWMTGINSDEGCLKSVWITANESRYQEFISGFDAISPVTFYYESSPYVNRITKKIREKYIDRENEDDIKRGILEAYSDSYFDYPALEAVELTSKYTKNPIYLYKLAYRAANSFSQIFGDETGDYGVCHADDLMHLFPIHFLKNPFTEKDIEMSKLIVTLWTNFASSGNPTLPIKVPLDWLPLGKTHNMEYLEISSAPSMKSGLAERSSFWEKLPLWHKTLTRVADEL